MMRAPVTGASKGGRSIRQTCGFEMGIGVAVDRDGTIYLFTATSNTGRPIRSR
jgi:hypothetical protein